MTNPTRKADEVLTDLAFGTGQFGENFKTADVAEAQKALYEDVCKNVIGEYDKFEMDANRPDNEPDVKYRNQLRAEQRKAAAKYFGVSDDTL